MSSSVLFERSAAPWSSMAIWSALFIDVSLALPSRSVMWPATSWSSFVAASIALEAASMAFPKSCRMTVRKTTIEALVAQAARDALDNVETKGVVADLVISYEASVDGEPCQSEVIQKELDHIRLAYNRVWKAIEEGTVPPGGKERIDSLKAREELLLQELRTTRAIEGRRLTRDVIIGWLGRLDEMDPEEIIASFVERVWIDGDDVTIRFAFDKTVTVSSSGFSTAPPKTRRASTPCVSRCCGTRGIRPCGGAASTVVPPICELLSTTKQIVLIKFGAWTTGRGASPDGV